MIRGIGIDSVQLHRIARVYAEYGEKLLARILTDAEREYVLRWADPVPRIAGRFAAKEACMKALGTGWGAGVRWRDIEVRRGPAGAPVATLRGRAAEHLAGLGASRVLCTITHTDDHAMAMIILE
ncbi:MAG TPA: holo-ACP synthase [Candidatus Krumholzibacteria bacterium]|nr:holo-ACP synthase [Candidatus Krumholzibacteria bacterium]